VGEVDQVKPSHDASLTLWREGPTFSQMKRALKSLVVGYLVLAFVSKAREGWSRTLCELRTAV
jgi:hypothetical protein